MKSVEDPRCILAQFAVGGGIAYGQGPILLSFCLSSALAIAIFPYFLLSPSVSLLDSFRPRNASTTLTVLRGNSNLPTQKVRVVLLLLIVAGCLFGFAGLVFTELFASVFTDLETRTRPGNLIVILVVGLFVSFKALLWHARKLG